MKIAVINGPNLQLLGTREPDIYGKADYAALKEKIERHCESAGVQVVVLQSDSESEIVGMIHRCRARADGIVLNPAAYTHTSVALLDALKAVGLPAVEVHISDVSARESFRSVSYVSEPSPAAALTGIRRRSTFCADLSGLRAASRPQASFRTFAADRSASRALNVLPDIRTCACPRGRRPAARDTISLRRAVYRFLPGRPLRWTPACAAG